ncbi:PREDICTED: uncharacterized protein LOC109234699 [Nicotiana attenuata]|uniref:uncharacterized protein LOC109234699 n=1 Tax=Nicotiana attenuata TaxID=49451 RepID=UPI000905465B|nr:PREDICTED: uncharacterized protein LOC109234699 [Nicotiana attenuata]
MVEAADSTIEDLNPVQLDLNDHSKKALSAANSGNQMFKEQLGKIIEVYIDDTLVKSVKAGDHIDHLKEAFDILRRYKMKLNPEKCAFDVALGKFLGVFGVATGDRGQPRPNQSYQKDTLALDYQEESPKDYGLEWTPKCIQALRELKASLSLPTLLSKPEPGEQLLVYLAVSEVAVSAVLIRESKDRSQPSHRDLPNQGTKVEKYHTEICKLLPEFNECQLDQIPRAQNAEADGLAKLALATKSITTGTKA